MLKSNAQFRYYEYLSVLIFFRKCKYEGLFPFTFKARSGFTFPHTCIMHLSCSFHHPQCFFITAAQLRTSLVLISAVDQGIVHPLVMPSRLPAGRVDDRQALEVRPVEAAIPSQKALSLPSRVGANKKVRNEASPGSSRLSV